MRNLLFAGLLVVIGFMGYKGYTFYSFFTRESLHYSQKQVMSITDHPSTFTYTHFYPYIADSVGQLSSMAGDTVTIYGTFYKGGIAANNVHYLLINGKDSVWARKDNFCSIYQYGLSHQQPTFKVHQIMDNIVWERATLYAKNYITSHDVPQKDIVMNDTLLSGSYETAMGGGNFYIRRKCMKDSTQYQVYFSGIKGLGTQEIKKCGYYLMSGQAEEKY